MSQVCDIHRVPLTGFGLECPACKAEERRHTEVVEQTDRHHQEEMEARERDRERAERAQEQEAQRALEAQLALDELAESSKIRLEEERRHRELEAERATLRAGVREFSPALQTQWQEVNAAREKVLALERSFQLSTSAMSASEAKLAAVANRELESLIGREGEFVRQALSTPESAFLGGLPENLLAPPGYAGRLKEVFRETVRASAPFLSDSVVARDTDPLLASSLWPALKSLEEARASAKPPGLSNLPEWVLWIPGVIGFMVGGELSATLVIAIGMGKNTFFQIVTLACGAGCGLLVAGLLGRYLNNLRKPHAEFIKTFDKLRETLKSDVGIDNSLTLHRRMTRAYVLSTTKTLAGSEPYLTAIRKQHEAASELERTERAFRESSPEREKIIKEYDFLKCELLRVGREIVEGIRVPGRLLQQTNCKQCGGPVTSETMTCPYCRSGHSCGGDI